MSTQPKNDSPITVQSLVKPSSQPSTDKSALEQSYQARQQFLVSSLTMSVELLIGFLGPILLGVYLDNSNKTKPVFTILGFVVAVVLAGLIVYKNVKIAKDKL